jgi:hypothetical protein
LDRSYVCNHCIGVLILEPKHRHVYVAREQSLADSLRELAEVRLIVERSKSWCRGMWAVSGLFDRVTAAAHATRNDLSALL